MKDESIGGPVNLTAPNPVTNADFAKILGRVLGRPALLPVPKFGPSLLLGRDMAQALLFDSANVVPTVLASTDFRYHHPELEVALRDILGKP